MFTSFTYLCDRGKLSLPHSKNGQYGPEREIIMQFPYVQETYVVFYLMQTMSFKNAVNGKKKIPAYTKFRV